MDNLKILKDFSDENMDLVHNFCSFPEYEKETGFWMWRNYQIGKKLSERQIEDRFEIKS